MVGSIMKTWERLAVLKVDDRYRVLLDKEVRELLRIAPGDEVLAIPTRRESSLRLSKENGSRSP